MTAPSLFGAPGPTAITVASGKGEEVAEEGRKRPVAVFWSKPYQRWYYPVEFRTRRLGFESLDEDTVEKRLYGTDGFECGCLEI